MDLEILGLWPIMSKIFLDTARSNPFSKIVPLSMHVS